MKEESRIEDRLEGLKGKWGQVMLKLSTTSFRETDFLCRQKNDYQARIEELEWVINQTKEN